MSVYLYDDALVNKLKKWTASTDVHIYSPDDTKRLFEVVADSKNDRPIQLPLICLRRKSGLNFTNINKKPMTYDGLTLNANYNKSLQLNAIPLDINYQLDIYTRYFKEADEFVRNFVFNIINYPTLQIVVPYNSANYIHNATIRMTSDVEDNSNIPERLVSGQFTRYTFNITIDDAYIWDAKYRDNYSIETTVDINNKEINRS